mmetsp:Transcript_7718/g.10654  ORF Transcript_7718/g.10654 Transcript_7718/m.10654 type:complete len:86 (-) Transcript_7718:120-377(-)|eukprot:CAMPEP_0168562790 /NCGR_PEP_ID=MMETSP0413-20121227/12321_1 /TAXON_ID=136452 /ORGANISM="Filamoeba nolandi, Strain NC-AS-23-1" /LENGTH=85 /DNA_ID=CAMNT_0008594261 /DNA_START=65 /DNA_END=322 /DNA_ORIENTATION=-
MTLSIGEVVPYSTPVSTALYPMLAIAFSLAGIFFFSSFIIYEVQTSGKLGKKRRNIVTELSLSATASVLLGLGVLFLLLWSGVYV